MDEADRSLIARYGAFAGLAVVLMAVCGGCLFLAILGDRATEDARAKAGKTYVDAAKAAVLKHFKGEVKIVSASLDRPTERGYLVGGQYQKPGDRARDFLASVDKAGDGCKVVQLIVDGDVVLSKP